MHSRPREWSPRRDAQRLGLVDCRLSVLERQDARGGDETALPGHLREAHERVERLAHRTATHLPTAPLVGLQQSPLGELAQRSAHR
jgi:hypothetical protein